MDLETIDVSFTGVSDGGMAAVSTCTRLGVLRISGCVVVTDQGVGNMFGMEASNDMKTWLESGMPAAKLFEGGFPVANRKTAQLNFLRVLDLSGVRALSDYALIAIGLHCPQLGALSLLHIGTFTDLGVTALSRGCNRLRRLALTDCRELSDLGMKSLIDFCPKLAAVRAFPFPVCVFDAVVMRDYALCRGRS